MTATDRRPTDEPVMALMIDPNDLYTAAEAESMAAGLGLRHNHSAGSWACPLCDVIESLTEGHR